MKKNDRIELEIIDNGVNFEGIARSENQVIFVPEALKGEVIDTKIIKVNKSYSIAKIENIIKKSLHRCEPFCEVYKRCGGCSAQHIEYDEQLNLKYKIIENVLKKQGVNYQNLNNTIGMGVPMYYRNKVQYPVRRNKEGVTKLGFYSKRSHEVVENNSCYIQHFEIDNIAKKAFDKLLQFGFSGYNEDKKDGDIRHIIVRRGFHTHETMIIFVVHNKEVYYVEKFEKIVRELTEEFEDIYSVYLNFNNSNTNEILGKNEKLVYGEPYIYDYIGEYKYAISPKSFFQVNTLQAEILYQTLKDELNLTQKDSIFDLYSGVGSIGIYLSDKVSNVYGIEIEKQAVEMANLNLHENHVTNAEYIAGSVEEKIEEFKNRNIKPDVIVVDPPRKGLDTKSIQYILDFTPNKIGYVSCNPATLARDLKSFNSSYDVISITPVDMFPQTSAIECVAVLEIKKDT